MTKEEKIASLSTAMTTSKRDNGEEFYHFTNEAPEGLKDLFLKDYQVADTDYMLFSKACDVVSEIYPIEQDEDFEEQVYEQATESLGYHTQDMLDVLDVWNQEGIADKIREYSCSVAEGCAYWADEQVQQMCFLIKNWIDEE